MNDYGTVDLVVHRQEGDPNVGSFMHNDTVWTVIDSSGQRPGLRFVGSRDMQDETQDRSVGVEFFQGKNRREQLNQFLADLHGQIQDHLKEEAPELLPED